MKARIFWPLVTVGLVARSLQRQRRIAALPVLPAAGPEDDIDPEHRFAWMAGATPDEATRRAASRYARAEGLDVVDLVPIDLPVEDLLTAARNIDPVRYRSDPLMPGHAVGQALLLTADVVKRAGLDRLEDLDPVEYDELVGRARRYAPRRTHLALAPELRASTVDPSPWRLGRLQRLVGEGAAPVSLAGSALGLVLMARAVARRQPWGLAAAVAYHAQPLLEVAGTAARPRDVPARVPVRAGRTAVELWQAVSRVAPKAPDPTLPRRREEYRALFAGEQGPLFEPRRRDCPMCGSTELSEMARTGDWLQRKPGTFVLDRCGVCEHVFQNPRLSIMGLDTYYKDFYDGLGADMLEAVFAIGKDSYQGRVAAMARVAEPRRWLDVGAGHGHFCLYARDQWPDTEFHGLDLSDSIEEAERRGWVDRGLLAMFPEAAPGLKDQYDAVSMHHYLEHTRDPRAELDAAATVLEPGGHLMIELPNPESAFGRWLGRWWGPWFQPQHQHFFSMGALEHELNERGFTVVERELGRAHQANDFIFSSYLAVNAAAPPGPFPWVAPPSAGQRVQRGATFLAGVPVVAAGAVLDNMLAPLIRRYDALDGLANAFRVVARLDDGAGVGAGAAGAS